MLSSAQIDLLQRLITADRRYRSRVRAGLPTHPDERGIEIGTINSVPLATARALERAGLVELSDTSLNRNLWVFLGSASPWDPVAE